MRTGLKIATVVIAVTATVGLLAACSSSETPAADPSASSVSSESSEPGEPSDGETTGEENASPDSSEPAESESPGVIELDTPIGDFESIIAEGAKIAEYVETNELTESEALAYISDAGYTPLLGGKGTGSGEDVEYDPETFDPKIVTILVKNGVVVKAFGVTIEAPEESGAKNPAGGEVVPDLNYTPEELNKIFNESKDVASYINDNNLTIKEAEAYAKEKGFMPIKVSGLPSEAPPDTSAPSGEVTFDPRVILLSVDGEELLEAAAVNFNPPN